MYTCGRCKRGMHPEENARVYNGQIVCIACYRHLTTVPLGLVPHVRPVSLWQRFWRWFA